jgi:hypothetical protein
LNEDACEQRSRLSQPACPALRVRFLGFGGCDREEVSLACIIDKNAAQNMLIVSAFDNLIINLFKCMHNVFMRTPADQNDAASREDHGMSR